MSKKLQNNFVYGMGSFFNIFNSEHKKCFEIAEKNNFYFHSSISYPGSSLFYKTISKNKTNNDKKLILKIAGYSYDQLRYEIDESLKEFKLNQLFGFQLWEKLPLNQNKINLKELTRIIYYLENLKKHKIIEKTFFQIEPDKFFFEEIDFFDGYAFYGYPYELQLEKKHFAKIIKADKILLQFQFFGGRSTKIFREDFKKKLDKLMDVKLDKLWIDECLNFSYNISDNNCLFVGCTQKSQRLEYLANLLSQKINYRNLEELNFSDNLKHLTRVNYPISKHSSHLKKIRSNWFLTKIYLKKFYKNLITRRT